MIKRKLLIFSFCAAFVASCSCEEDANNGMNNGGDDTGTMDAGDDMGADDSGGDDAGGDMGGGDGGGDMGAAGLHIPGLSAPVKVSYDPQGVLHVECQTNADCYAAQGYFHARDRFAQMDIRRRLASGTLSTLIGSAGVDVDHSMRQLFITRDGEPLADVMLDAATPETVAALEGYTRGVNAWLDDYRNGENDAKLAAEFGYPTLATDDIRDWTTKDSVGSVLLLMDDLSNQASGDLASGEAYAEVDSDTAFDLLGLTAAVQTATMPASGESYSGPNAAGLWPDPSQLQPVQEELRQRLPVIRSALDRFKELARFRPHILQPDVGSNNWVMGPSRTTSGNGILANDPHLSLSHPALWHLDELDSKTNGSGDLHAAGVSFPGLPGILLGHNEDVAWGATVVNWDLTDVYMETLNAAGTAVMFNGNEVPIETKEVTIERAGATAETRTISWVPHHGPLLSIDTEAGTAVTMRWAGNEAREDINLFTTLNRATNLAEARDAIKLSTSTNQNWIVLDKNNDIGWFPFNLVPERPWASLSQPPWLPLPGDGSAEWGNPIAKDDLPQMENPTNGFIATANQDATGARFDGDPSNESYPYLQGRAAVGFRHGRIVDVIEEIGNAHDVQTSIDLQGDPHLLVGEMLTPEIIATIDNASPAPSLSTAAADLLQALRDWDYTCPTGLSGNEPDAPKAQDLDVATASIGCTAFHYLLYTLTDHTFLDELANTEVEADSDFVVRSLTLLLLRPGDLLNGEDYWDDVTTNGQPESREDIIIGALEAAATTLTDEISTTPDDWRWGRVHTLTMEADLLDNFTDEFNAGPFAAPGGHDAVNVANPDGIDNMGFGSGPSMRIVVENGSEGMNAKMTFPGGNVHHRDSQFFDKLIDRWLNNEPFDLLFTREEVDGAAIETFDVSPPQ